MSSADLTELARREGTGQVRVRPTPLRMSWTFDDLVSSDGHGLSAAFSCSLRALPSPAEQKMLAEVFLASSSVARGDAVTRHFASALRAAAAGVCQAAPASDLVGSSDAGADGRNAPAAQAALLEALKTAANKVAFSCGLEVLAPFHIDVASQTLERQRLEAMQRSLAEQRAAGQLEHFQRAAELLKQFNSLRQSAPDLSAGEVLKQLNPADQGTMLQTLLLASGRQTATRAVWAVAGPSLLRIDPQSPPARADVIPLPATLGPLRSVQPALSPRGLLVGARSGILHLRDGQSPAADVVAYTDSSVTSQLGFNRAVISEDGAHLWASHSEAGLVAWKLGQGEVPAATLRPSQLGAGGAAPRNLQVLDSSRLVFSSNTRLMVLDADPGSPDPRPVGPDLPREVIALLPHGDRLFVILKDGTVQERSARTLEVTRQEKRSPDVCAACLMPWLSSVRLILATETGPVFCVGPDDDLVTQYLSPYSGLRCVAAAADIIAGISNDRQRIVIWNTWTPRQPSADLFVTSLARHRAADVDI
jgi:hypothetical protein